MTAIRLAIAVVATCTIAAPQNVRPTKDEIDLPIPIASRTAVQPGTIEPLTPKEKAMRALNNVASPMSIANRALLAGWAQVWDSPEEWDNNWEGYGKRMGITMTRLAVRRTLQLGTDLAFKTDPRFDRCDCETFWSRTGHAWKRVFVARKDNGGEMVNVSNVVGAYVPPMITNRWMPERYNTWGNKLESGSTWLLTRGATNMLREFWPDISRKFRIGRFKPGD